MEDVGRQHRDIDRLNKYDAVVLTCTGIQDSSSTSQQSPNGSNYSNYRAEMKAYADLGGKVFVHRSLPANTS